MSKRFTEYTKAADEAMQLLLTAFGKDVLDKEECLFACRRASALLEHGELVPLVRAKLLAALRECEKDIHDNFVTLT